MAKIKKIHFFEEKIKTNKIKESRTGEDWKVFLETCLVNSANRILITVRGWKRFQMRDQHGWKKNGQETTSVLKVFLFVIFVSFWNYIFKYWCLEETLNVDGHANRGASEKGTKPAFAERETTEIGWKDREEINHRSKYQNKHIFRNKVPFITPPSLSLSLFHTHTHTHSNMQTQMRNWCNHFC